MNSRWRLLFLGLSAVLRAALGPAGTAEAQTASAERGAYVYALAGCQACHTAANGPVLAGGRSLKTPFGLFYGPNITPDPDHGIGRWSDADFIRALREGVGADGSHLYPVFPYTAFTRMTDADMLDLKAYIFSLPAVPQPDRLHDVNFPFGWRFLLTFWKWLNFSPGPFEPDPAQSPGWNRGAYIVRAMAHCGECHTPRGWLGGVDEDLWLAGGTPEGERAPNITPDPETGIGAWSAAEVRRVLKSGMLPDGDFVGSLMGEVVNNGTSKMTDADLDAVLTYLATVPPVANSEAKATQPEF